MAWNAHLMDGKGNLQADAIAAARYLKLCADNQKSEDKTKGECLFSLSIVYMGQPGVPEDIPLAFSTLWRAARYGNEKAIAQLTESICSKKGPSCPDVLQQRITQCSEPCLQ